MVARGHVQNGVVVLADGVRLPEGQEVTVVTSECAVVKDSPVTDERKKALLGLIGIWKTDAPPNDEEVEQILNNERQKKYG